MSVVERRSRVNDYIYDPAYIVSGPKDFYKQAYNTKIATAKYAICPIFPTMFSDLRNYPRKQYVMRKSHVTPVYIDKIRESRSTLKLSRSTLIGQDRHKYFHNPITGPVPKLEFPCFYSVDAEKKLKDTHPKKGSKNVKVQTVFRESSAQTSPWEPDYKVVQGDPELLKLDFLKWGAGLPAGVHEVTLIERARMKRKWEKSLPPIIDKKSFEERSAFIEAIARDEWIFREQEIQDIQDLRLELLEKMLNELQAQSKCRTQKKMRTFIDLKLKEKNEKINKLHKDANRELRRLEFNYKGILSKYGHVNVYDEHSDYKSELYIPLIRHGTNPKYGHQMLSKSLKKYKSQFCGVENVTTLPSWVKSATKLSKVKLPGTRLCIRETKWTTPVLKKLHEELKNLRNIEKKYPNLRVALVKEESEIPTPQVDGCEEAIEHKYQDCVFLQKILRGRAAQYTIFEGRERCRELIDELRSSFPLLRIASVKQMQEKKETKQNQRDAIWCKQNITVLERNLKKMGGYVTGTLLDFLNKELNRLLGERKIHAMMLMIERERMKREAAEAGRRQLELRRRKEHDEIFKQVVKVHQDTVELYLQDIITEGMNFASETEAKDYVDNLATKIDSTAEEMESKLADVTFTEEYVADLVHHFVIPEVEKTIVRQGNVRDQRKYLVAAHDEIYNNLDKVQSTVKLSRSSLESDVGVIDYEAICKAQEEERKLVLADIQAILDELITIPTKQQALSTMVPCLQYSEELIGEPSSSSSSYVLSVDRKSLPREFAPIEEEELHDEEVVEQTPTVEN